MTKKNKLARGKKRFQNVNAPEAETCTEDKVGTRIPNLGKMLAQAKITMLM